MHKISLVKNNTFKYTKYNQIDMVKLQEVNGRYFLTIPKEYVAEKGWVKGQVIVIGYDQNGNLILKDVKK